MHRSMCIEEGRVHAEDGGHVLETIAHPGAVRAAPPAQLSVLRFIVSLTLGLAASPPLRATLAPHLLGEEGQENGGICGGNRRRRSHGDDAGGGADAGGDRRPHRRAAPQLYARELALPRSALPHHRS